MTNASIETLDADSTPSPAPPELRKEVVVIASKDLTVMSRFFTMNGVVLRKRIAAYKDDYNRDDPKTWPIFMPTEQNQDIISSSSSDWTLPVEVAYTSPFMNMYADLCHDRKVRGREIECSSLFRDYPYNFTETGERRFPQHLSESDYDTWMRNFGDLEALSAHNAARALAQKPQATPQVTKRNNSAPDIISSSKLSSRATDTRTNAPALTSNPKVSNTSINAPVATQNSALSPDAAYERVMNTLRAPNVLLSDEVIELRKELQDTKNHLQDTKDELKTCMEETAKNKALLTASRTKLGKAEKDLESAYGVIKSLNQVVQNNDQKMDDLEKNKQLAEKGLSEEKKVREKAEKRVLDIWVQMQQIMGPKEGQKRAFASDEDYNGDISGEGGSTKRPRTAGASGNSIPKSARVAPVHPKDEPQD